MEILTNCEISKVYEGPSGSGQYGPWQIFNFYVKDHKEKFSVFGKDEFVPVPGIKLKLLKYEIKHSEKDDKKYTNYDVKEVILEDEQPGPAPQPTQTHPQTQKSSQRDNTLTMYVSYAKDLMVKLLEEMPTKERSLGDLAKEVVKAGKIMYDIAQEAAEAPGKPKEPEDKAQPPANVEDPYQGDAPPISSYEGEPPF